MRNIFMEITELSHKEQTENYTNQILNLFFFKLNEFGGLKRKKESKVRDFEGRCLRIMMHMQWKRKVWIKEFA